MMKTHCILTLTGMALCAAAAVAGDEISVMYCDNGQKIVTAPSGGWGMLSWERTRRCEILAAYERREFGKIPKWTGEVRYEVACPDGEGPFPLFLFIDQANAWADGLANPSAQRMLKRKYAVLHLKGCEQAKSVAELSALALEAFARIRRDGRIDPDHIVLVGEGRGGSAALWAAANHRGVAGVAVKNEHAVAKLGRAALFASLAPRPLGVATDGDPSLGGEAEFRQCVEASELYPIYGITGLDISVWPGNVDYVNRGGRIGHHVLAGKNGLVVTDWNRWADYFDWQGFRGFKAADPSPYPDTPDVLTARDGTKLATVADWEKKGRPEIVRWFESNVYGKAPPCPADLRFVKERDDESILNGRAIRRHVRAEFSGPNGKCSFGIVATIPTGRGKAPAFVWISYSQRSMRNEQVEDTLVSRGYALVQYRIDQYAPDYGEFAPERADWRDRHVFACYRKPGERKPDDWGAIAAWAWGASRVLDWMTEEPLIDETKAAIVGLSRGGKTALWAGVTDTRWAMACPSCSGCMGPRLNRVDIPQREPLWLLQRIQHFWFCDSLRAIADCENEWPYDMHQLAACVAPRTLVVTDGRMDHGAGPEGGFQGARLASHVWGLYGLKGLAPESKMPQEAVVLGESDGHVFFNHHKNGHEVGLYDWNRFMDIADRQYGWAAR